MVINDRLSLEAVCFRTSGERLRHFRKILNKELREVAAATGISIGEISRLENDKRRVNNRHLDLFSKAYDIPEQQIRDLLNYDPAVRIARFRREQAAITTFRMELPCYPISALLKYGFKRCTPETVGFAMQLPVSGKAYAIKSDLAAGDTMLPADSIYIIDPAVRAVLGDLVVNTDTWEPVMINLRRDSAGILYGAGASENRALSKDASMEDFHKVMVVFQASHLVLY